MATAAQMGLSGVSGKPTTSKDCVECDTPIHPLRLARNPQTDLCARCQEQSGDVERVRGEGLHRRVYGGYEHERFGLIDRDEQRDGVVVPITAQRWNEVIRPEGTATSTRVVSDKGREGWKDNGKKAWATRRKAQ